jgi:hypothetical protein
MPGWELDVAGGSFGPEIHGSGDDVEALPPGWPGVERGGWMKIVEGRVRVAGSLIEPICRRHLEQRALGRRLPGSGPLHAAAFLQLLGHR